MTHHLCSTFPSTEKAWLRSVFTQPLGGTSVHSHAAKYSQRKPWWMHEIGQISCKLKTQRQQSFFLKRRLFEGKDKLPVLDFAVSAAALSLISELYRVYFWLTYFHCCKTRKLLHQNVLPDNLTCTQQWSIVFNLKMFGKVLQPYLRSHRKIN